MQQEIALAAAGDRSLETDIMNGFEIGKILTVHITKTAGLST